MAFRFPDDVCLAYVREKIYNGAMDEKIRINKYLSEAGFCSRREADSLIQEGRVTVDGRRAEPGEKITSDTVVYVDGKAVKKVEEKVLLLFYKPRGVVCSTKKQRQETTVTEYLNYPLRVYPIGRLDKDSEGLLLLTNDGAFANALMHPKHEVEKAYLVQVSGYTPERFQQLARPITLDGYRIKPPVLRLLAVKGDKCNFEIIIHEGRNRQIRRMCEAAGMQVLRLRRIREGAVTLGNLPLGKWRHLTREEVKELAR